MEIKTYGEVKDYKTSPIFGKLLTVSIEHDIAEQLDELKDQPVELTIKPIHAGRSRNANAYLWTMLTQLQNAGFGNAVTLYKRYIRENGVSVAYELPERAFGTYEITFTHMGLGFQIERTGDSMMTGKHGETIPTVQFVQYYGSHVYNKKQMNRLLDAVIQDCKAVGIQTETPEELARMIESWSPQ